MNSTRVPDSGPAQAPLDPSDPVLRQLAEAVATARAAAEEEAREDEVGEHAGFALEDAAAVTHLFEAHRAGYRGWCWAVTVASTGPDRDVTISEVVLLPGPDALVAPEWVPWQQRVQAGDLGVGDLMYTAPDDPRLVPGYLASDDPAVEETAAEAGLGRVRVMSRPARLEAAERWKAGEFGPRSDMARGAPGQCATCGFYLPLDGSLRAAFGVCGNEIAPADGHLVHAEYGCGAHSEAEVEQVSPVLVADLIYDDNALLDIEVVELDEPPAADANPAARSQADAAADGDADLADDSAADAGAVAEAGAAPADDADESPAPAASDAAPPPE
ncbi:MAG: DUF3027 domain-containing protein [Labedaea sp.]